MNPHETLTPDTALLAKLGSIAVHAKEFMGPNGSMFDKEALKTLFTDEDVRAWLKQMDAMALIPKMR